MVLQSRPASRTSTPVASRLRYPPSSSSGSSRPGAQDLRYLRRNLNQNLSEGGSSNPRKKSSTRLVDEDDDEDIVELPTFMNTNTNDDDDVGDDDDEFRALVDKEYY